MSTVFWVCQGLIAAAMLVSGVGKSFMSKERMLQTGQSGVAGVTLPTIRFIGVSELLGVLGVTLPWLTGIAPWLTPLAALGFAVVMVLAFRVHTRLMRRAATPEGAAKENRNRINNLVLLALSLVVAVGRGYELVWARA